MGHCLIVSTVVDRWTRRGGGVGGCWILLVEIITKYEDWTGYLFDGGNTEMKIDHYYFKYYG